MVYFCHILNLNSNFWEETKIVNHNFSEEIQILNDNFWEEIKIVNHNCCLNCVVINARIDEKERGHNG